MVAAVTISSPQARVFSVAGAVSPDLYATQARAFAVINYPAENIKATQARVLAVVRDPADTIQMTQARVLVVGRGAFYRPRMTAWTFTLDGHDFYVLQTLNETLVCDLSQDPPRWHVWGSGSDAIWRWHTGLQWQRPLTLANTYGSNIVVGDNSYGVLGILNPRGQTDEHPDSNTAAVPFRRVVVGQIALRGRASVPCWGVEVYGSLGQQNTDDYISVTLYTSDDRGNTFDNQGSQDVTVGSYGARLEWLSLGQMQAPGRLIMVEDFGAIVRIDGLEMPEVADATKPS